MAGNENAKACQYCAEPIRALAKVCPHCRRLQTGGPIYLNDLAGYSFNWLIGKRKKIMSAADETKPCDYCAEPIRTAARVCPYCRHLQSRWQFKKQLEAWSFLLVFGLMIFGGLYCMKNAIGPGRDFKQFQSQILISNPEMHFGASTNGNFISTIGQMQNQSPYSWKNIQLEVQYFDKDGRLIDTRMDERYGYVLPAGETQSFRIRGPADKPEAAYITQKVFVRAAKDSNTWP